MARAKFKLFLGISSGALAIALALLYLSENPDCPTPKCNTLASSVSSCTCGTSTYNKMPWHMGNTYCCSSNTGEYNLQRSPCENSIDKQFRMRKAFCHPITIRRDEIFEFYKLTPGVYLKIHPALIPILDSIKEELTPYYPIIRQKDSMCYAYRKVRTIKNEKKHMVTYSAHAFGIAIDINWSTNPFCPIFKDVPACVECESAKISDLPPKFIDIMESAGFEWGGDWNIPDSMHFELKEEYWPEKNCSDWRNEYKDKPHRKPPPSLLIR